MADVTGLRERKKQRTRDALIRAAHELFVAHGYESTTVDAIAAAVDVSQRTFFRYFAGKEEVALSLQRLVDEHYLTAVRERPPGEPPMEVLRRTLDETWQGLDEAIEEIVPIELHMRMWQVVETTPTLLAVHLRHSAEMEERLAAEIARREGVDVDADPRPRVLVAAYSGVLRTAGRRWGAGGDASLPAARRFVESYVDRLGPALGGDWHGAGQQRGGGAPDPTH